MPITAAGVTLISPDAGAALRGGVERSALRFEKLQTELGEGPCLAAYHTGEAVSVPDLRQRGPVSRASRRGRCEAGLAAVFTFPLRHGDVPARGA